MYIPYMGEGFLEVVNAFRDHSFTPPLLSEDSVVSVLKIESDLFLLPYKASGQGPVQISCFSRDPLVFELWVSTNHAHPKHQITAFPVVFPLLIWQPLMLLCQVAFKIYMSTATHFGKKTNKHKNIELK